MKYEELIEEARDYFLPGDEPSVEYRTVEALESVVKENAALRESIEYLSRDIRAKTIEELFEKGALERPVPRG